ncbi:GNAT family N-acetyltransferase [Burkholderia humptydooensis]|uniref:GNAT family N-acetyltransferase n=3 Tax=Burkholderiaceae TaxID=119060 RepID=A0A7T2TZE6_9BURK|nr:acetyltransferase domain protein [Burkholderia sp. 2002721687]EIP88692.1 acetyltransferase, GNAT family protein [Burkholderia humptydooensis MSMB43]QPS42796.1 GNAT family N-acetyltransferase [Burkholderia humptydooensis]
MSAGDTTAIRAAAAADVPAMLALMRELAKFEQLTHLFVATEADLADALFGARPSAEALVAVNGTVNGGAIVGYALYFHNYSTFVGRRGLYLEDLYVQPSQRGTGLGTRMLRRLAAIAVERRCARFEWTVLDWNQPAIEFYRKMGAQIMPDWRVVRVTGDTLAQLANGTA